MQSRRFNLNPHAAYRIMSLVRMRARCGRSAMSGVTETCLDILQSP